MLVVRCYCLPENPDKLGQPVVGHCPAAESDCCTSGTATGRKISSLYLTAVILPATIINCDFIPWAMPPQTITEPPPNRSRLTTQALAKRSPQRRYTRRRPSAQQQRQQERGTPDIDFQFDFDFKIWGVATNELQLLETCWSQTNEIWNFCSIHIPFCNHSKIFNKLFQTWMKFWNKIYPAFLFPFSICTIEIFGINWILSKPLLQSFQQKIRIRWKSYTAEWMIDQTVQKCKLFWIFAVRSWRVADFAVTLGIQCGLMEAHRMFS